MRLENPNYFDSEKAKEFRVVHGLPWQSQEVYDPRTLRWYFLSSVTLPLGQVTMDTMIPSDRLSTVTTINLINTHQEEQRGGVIFEEPLPRPHGMHFSCHFIMFKTYGVSHFATHAYYKHDPHFDTLRPGFSSFTQTGIRQENYHIALPALALLQETVTDITEAEFEPFLQTHLERLQLAYAHLNTQPGFKAVFDRQPSIPFPII